MGIAGSGLTGLISSVSKVKDNSDGITELISGLTKVDDIAKVLSLGEVSEGVARVSLKAAGLADSTDLVLGKMAEIKKSTKGVEGLGMAFTGLGGSIKSTATALASNPLTWVAAATAGIAIVYNIHKKNKEDLIKSSTEITSSWKDATASLEEQKQKYIELKSQLSSGTLDESETYNVKMQILDLQQQISSSYGDQVDGINLINGGLNEQLAILEQIAVKEAQQKINESKEEYDDAKKEMTKDRQYTIGWAGNDIKNGIGKELNSIVSKYKDVGLSLEDAGGEGFFIKYSGDAAQASETINSFMNDVTALKQEFSDDDQTQWFLDNKVLNQSSKQLSKNSEILDKYQNNYKSFLEMDMYSKGMGENDPATLFNKYTDAVNEYNQALASGDASSIDKAALNLQKLQPNIDSLLSNDATSQYKVLFDDVTDQLQTSTIKAHDFNQALGGKVGDANQFKEKAKDIKKVGEELKNLELDGADVMNALTTKGKQAGEDTIRRLSREWGINSDSTSEEIQAFTNALIDAGIVSGTASDQIDALAESFANTELNVQSAISNMEALKSIMSESTTGTGMSKESVQAFRDMFGSDAEKALEKTANGYHLNKKAVAELQSQQESLTKAGVLSELSDQYEQLRIEQTNLAKASMLKQDTTDPMNNIADIESRINALRELQFEYDAANSAYNDWLAAQSGGEESDQYDSMSQGAERLQELYDKEKWGSNDFIAGVNAFSAKTITTAAEARAEWEALGQVILSTFQGTDTRDGLDNFASRAKKASEDLDESWVTWNDEMNDWEFAPGIDDQKLADQMGVSVEAVQAALKAFSIFGYDIQLDQPLASLDELKTKAQEAKDALSNSGDATLGDLNLDSSSLSEVTNNIDTVEKYIESLKSNEGIPLDVKTEKLEDATEVLDYLVAQQDQLTAGGELSFAVNTDELEAAGNSLNDILESKNMKTIEFDFEADIDGINDQINDVMIVIDSLRDRDGTLDINAEGVQEAQAMLQGLLAQKELLSAPEVMQVDTSALATVDADMATAITKIQEFQNAVSNLNILEGMKSAGIDVDTTAAQQKVQELAGEISGMEDARATLGLDTAEFDGALASITGTPIDVQAGVNLDRTQLDTAIAGIGAMDLTYVTNLIGDLPKDEDKKLQFTASIVGDVPKDEDKKVTYAASITNKPTDLSRSLTYNVSINGSLPGGNPANGTAHVQGTAYAYGSTSGRAYASGDWSVRRNGMALVGELGQETVVRNGHFFTVGDSGAHFTNLQRGDIVFNHRQTEELFKHGYVTSGGGHGRAYASGTAYSSGTPTVKRKSTPKYSTKKKSSKPKSKSTSKSSSKSADEAKKAAEDALKQITGYFDWVAELLDYANEATKKAMDAIEDAVGLANKQASTSIAISKTQEEMIKQNQAFDRYMSHANWFADQAGLGATERTLVQNGSLDIYKYDDDTKTKIEEYKKWYDAAQDCKDKIDELKKQEKELAIQRLEHIQDYYDAVISVYDATQSANDAKMELYTALGNDVDSKEIKDVLENSISQQKSSYDKSMRQLADYQRQFNDLVAQGYIQRDSDAWHEGQKVIQEFTAQVDESAVALIELQDQLREIDYTVFQQTIDRISHSLDRLENGIKIKEKRGERVPESEYRDQIAKENESINANHQLRKKKLKEQALYAVGSARYNEIAEEVAKIDDQIFSSIGHIAELKKSISEVRFADFYDDREAMKDLTDDLDNLRKFFKDDSLVDSKTGILTGEGLASIALIGQSIAIAKQEIAEYTTGIKKLDGMLKSGLISTADYKEKQREFLDAINDSSHAVDDYKSEILDLHKKQLTYENDALKESIGLRQKAHKEMNNYYDYANSVNEKTKDVNAIRAQIEALRGVNNLQAQSELKRLQSELAEKEKALAETKKDHSDEMISKGYDEMSENLDKNLEKTLYDITYNANKQEEVIANMLNNVVGMYDKAYSTIQDKISSTGIVGTGDFNNSINNIGSSVGASNIVSGATQSQNTISSGNTTNSIATGNVGKDTSAIEADISKEIDTKNRLCAELKIDKTSVSLQEGQNTSVSVSIRPTDAKNKSLKWSSSNPSVATVSNGIIRAKKPGGATITASTTDGSGLSVACGVTVTAKPAPPPPKPPTPTSSQGDGIVQVGDKVIYTTGQYFVDSYGSAPIGSKYRGSQVTITKMNPKGSRPYHISTGDRLGVGDLGWLTLSQIRGYATGARRINKDQLAFVDDTLGGKADPGSEAIMTEHGRLQYLKTGDTVFNKAQTQRLWEISKGMNNNMFSVPDGGVNAYSVEAKENNYNVSVSFDSLITVEGNATPETIKVADRDLPELASKLGIYLGKELRKM